MMIADVTHYTIEEGGDWYEWPFPKNVKPSNPELLTLRSADHVTLIMNWPAPLARAMVRVHALKLSDGSEWDSINGFRDGGGPR